jgi:hypothetical protein
MVQPFFFCASNLRRNRATRRGFGGGGNHSGGTRRGPARRQRAIATALCRSVDQTYTVFGAAWAGETDATEIAVSTDGGQTWAEAHFLDPVRRHAWRRWKFDWLTPRESGHYTLLARAKDANGTVQPDEHDWNYGSYMISHLLPIEVLVDDPVHPER